MSFKVAASCTSALPPYIRRCLSGEGLVGTASHIFVLSSATVVEMGTLENVSLLGTSIEGEST